MKKLSALVLIQFATVCSALDAQPIPTIERFSEMLIDCVFETSSIARSTVDVKPDSSVGFKRELDLRLQAAVAERNHALKESSLPVFHRSTLRYAVQSAKTAIKAESDFFIRTITFAVNIEVIEDSTVWVKSFAKSRRDTLLEQEIELIDDSRYPETRFQTPQNLFSKAIFPTLVTASLGVIVYLFFSIRSN